MTAPLLQLKGVHTHIGAYHILHGVDFDVPAGEVTMLLGRNGAGKTTTLRTVMGLWRASAGDIRFRGRSIAGLETPAIASLGIAYVPERMGIFGDLTVRDNIVLAARRARHAGELDGARMDWIFGLFPALKTFWMHPAGKLSGGQKQMLAVARAICEPRALILIDEPTAGMSVDEVPVVLDLIRALKAQRDRTILLVEHKMDVVRELADRIIVLHDGKLVADGEPAAVIASPVVQQAYLGVGREEVL